MPRIKIEDLPVLEELSQQQAKGIFGGDDGMTQIDPPSLKLEAAPDDYHVESTSKELQGLVKLC